MKMPPLPRATSARSACPIANILDLIGDRWTLLVIRDLRRFRKARFKNLAETRERIPTNLLADRLRRLEQAGIVEKRAYQQRPVRYEYELTARGIDLLPVLREMAGWANRHISGTAHPPEGFFSARG
jgi:DNA-binding HxlR family transcriptional regulator